MDRLARHEGEAWAEVAAHVATKQPARYDARSRCSAYDCEFVALAEDLDVGLVTGDRQVLAAFPEVARGLGG